MTNLWQQAIDLAIVRTARKLTCRVTASRAQGATVSLTDAVVTPAMSFATVKATV